MAYDLRKIIKRSESTRKPSITLRAIYPTQAQAMSLAALLVQVPRAWHEIATGPVLDAYARALAQLQAGGTRDGPDEIKQELDKGEDSLYRLLLELGPKMRGWAFEVDQWHRGQFARAVLASANVNLAAFLGPQGETVEAFYNGMLSLIRSVDDDTRAKVSGIVWRGFQQQTPRRELAKQITQATNIQRARALRIASDQTVKLSARLDQARQEEAGFDEFEWIHSRKLKPRPVHVARNGLIYKWAKPPADGPPGTQPYCGCKARAHMVL